jgi:hypothetical protein
VLYGQWWRGVSNFCKYARLRAVGVLAVFDSGIRVVVVVVVSSERTACN